SNFFNIGAAGGGFIASFLIPHFGWRSVFVVGGVVPLVIALLMLAFLPESLQFLALKGTKGAQIRRYLTRMRIPLPAPDALFARTAVPEAVPFVDLFRFGRSGRTVMLWVLNFANLLNLYLLASWLPTVVRNSGYDAATAVLIGTMVQLGGAIGTIPNGWLIDRFGFRAVLTVVFAIAAGSIALLGETSLPLACLYVAAFIAGWCVPGGQAAVNALAAISYPTNLRATGIGASLGFGRFGAIVGPLIAAAALSAGWTGRDLFHAAAFPALLSMVAVYSMKWVPFEAPKLSAESAATVD
ncbi:MAG TPA: MFS transporter, partial [Terriglobales bacterium]|nr:MFS transporter [Terriglobales bacterium]